MQNLQILPSIPNEFSPSVPTSSSDFVVSRRMREYVADGQTTFSYDGTNVIKFTLNSADSFLDGRNSWLQFKLWATAAAGGNWTAQELSSRFLESGGAHSLFRRLRISLSNGTIISDYDYSALYSMVRQHTMSTQHLEHQEGLSSYDGLQDDIYDATCNQQIVKPQGVALANGGLTARNAANGCATFTYAGIGNDVKLGDEVVLNCSISGAAAFAQSALTNSIVGKVRSITDADNVLLEMAVDYGAYAAGAAMTNIRGYHIVNRGDLSARWRGAQGSSEAGAVLCKIKLFSDFFNNIKYLPLPFLRNLTIELELNRPAHSVVIPKSFAALTPNFVWTIKDPVIVANLVTPSESLMNAYVDQYNSEQGIMLHWIDYQSNKRTLTSGATSESVIIPSNCHSALAILVAQKPDFCESVNASTWCNDTNGISVKGRIQSYQFQIGSEYFPFNRSVRCGEGADATRATCELPGVLSNGNAWNYVLTALDSHGAKYECSSIIKQDYLAVNNIAVPSVGVGFGTDGRFLMLDSSKFYMAARLDRDNNYTGVDTSNNDIQLNFTRTGAYQVSDNASPFANLTNQAVYLHSFIVHNRLMRISKASSIVFS